MNQVNLQPVDLMHGYIGLQCTIHISGIVLRTESGKTERGDEVISDIYDTNQSYQNVS